VVPQVRVRKSLSEATFVIVCRAPGSALAVVETVGFVWVTRKR
jgi:hypothetical protein